MSPWGWVALAAAGGYLAGSVRRGRRARHESTVAQVSLLRSAASFSTCLPDRRRLAHTADRIESWGSR